MPAASDYEPVIGLEIHVQLRTRTKMFCGCALSFGDEPNLHTCPVCLGHPGTLPVANERAVHYGLMIAVALGCEVAPRSIFHRKNYFYPDLPKGYQISQYDIPLASGGRLGEIRVHRVHLEEDAAKLTHVGESGRIHGSGASLVDFNRGGTPLVEIVTEPDLRSSAQAREWGQLLRTTMRQIGVSELKNMNSFRFRERGIEAELARQRELLGSRGEVEQETLHFDPSDGSLTSLRSKEEAHDYRYFPEPDLVPLAPTEEMIAAAREQLPELPAERRERYATELGLPDDVAATLAFNAGLGDYFEAALAAAPSGDGVGAKALANWVVGDLTAAVREAGFEEPAESEAKPEAVAKLAAMVETKQVNRSAAKQVLVKLAGNGGDPAAIVEREGLGAVSDSGELATIVDAAIAANADAVEQVRSGNEKAIGAIIGAVMRETKGRADGGEVQKLIRDRIDSK